MIEILCNKLFGEKNGEAMFERFKNIKKYAEQHTSLFITILTGVITAIFCLINFMFYCYDVGYFGYFGVNQDILRENLQILNLSNNYFLQILYSVSIGMILVLFNVLGYVYYINGKFLNYYLAVTLLTGIYLGVKIFIEGKEKWSVQLILGIILVSIFISGLILVLWFNTLFSYYRTITLKRYIIKFKYFKKQGDGLKALKIKKKYKKLVKKGNYKKQKSELQIDVSIKNIISICLVMSYFAIIAGSGYFMAFLNRTMNTINSVLENQLDKSSSYAVTYEADDFLMISPCYEENGELHIFKNCQIKIERSNQLLMKQTYKKIIMEHAVLLSSKSE